VSTYHLIVTSTICLVILAVIAVIGFVRSS
jgi:hypothetical protein